MSQKQTKHFSPGARAPRGGGGGRKTDESAKQKSKTDVNYNENVVRKLYECFKDIFDYDLVASVCHTCEWDAVRATEALMVLGDATYVNRRSKGNKDDVNKNKPKSLPSTLKSNKSNEEKGNNSLYAMRSSLRSNPAHMSTSSLSSGQVWQRHYKSKPQSPGLLTMIPPHSKEATKLKKSVPARPSTTQNLPSKNKENSIVKKTNEIVKRIQNLVQNGVNVMVLMRGVPGSGKTHLAEAVVNLVTDGAELSQHIFSTDDYFILLGRGNYAYDAHQLPLAHNWNQRRVFEALRRATNPVVVDNTHTQAWEMEPYVTMAVSQGYVIEVLEPVTPWRTKEAELAKRNIHSVPREKIRQMLERYETGWTGEKLKQSFGLNCVPCGSVHSSQDHSIYNDTPLGQHRQHAVIDTPEKPKRKKSSPKKKDRRHLAGIEITEDKEKQLEELNELFAEYGKTMDPVSKKKVLESGVPISEVVSRMRKLQGNVLPLPKAKCYPSNLLNKDRITEVVDDSATEPIPHFSILPRESPCESVEPDTMSSSNASETSECESDTEAEVQIPASLKGMKIFNCRTFGLDGPTIDGVGNWEDEDNENEGLNKKRVAVGDNVKSCGGITSSQEELSLIDFEFSTNPACSSQEELSLLDFDDGDENRNSKEDLSSSSEEQETQLLKLQESLREVLLDNYDKIKVSEQSCEMTLNHTTQGNDLTNSCDNNTVDTKIQPSPQSLMNSLVKHFEDANVKFRGESSVVENDLVNYLLKNYDADNSSALNLRTADNEECHNNKKSPDLEEIPLPGIPPNTPGDSCEDALAYPKSNVCPSTKPEAVNDILSDWESSDKQPKRECHPKPERPKTAFLGAIKKTGIQRDKSPEELLRSVELSWSSIPFTSSWEDITKKNTEKKELAQCPKPQRKSVNKSDSSTNTMHSDFDLWKLDNDEIIKLTPHNRNINQHLVIDPAQRSHITEYPMLDKSSMTSDFDESNLSTMDSSLEMLSGMFPDIQIDNLADILEKCKGNIHWAVELLLDSPQNIEIPSDKKFPDVNFATTGPNSDVSNVPKTFDNLVISDGKKTIKKKRDRKTAPSELSLMLKKQIEDGIHINEDCYQDKTLFLKKLRHGEIQLDDDPVESILKQPIYHMPGFNANSTDVSGIYSQQSVECPPEEDEEEEEETIPMRIEPEFFQKLAAYFGHSVETGHTESHHSVSVINIPISLGHQIYSCWLETVNRQVEEMQNAYDNMIKEDELLAKALQEQEHDHHKPDVREIMDMELAMALYKQDQGQSHGNNQETIACKLSKQLLFEAFPNIDRNVILEIFHGQGYSFQKTVDLLSSREGESPKTVVAPEFLEACESKLIEQAREEAVKEDTDVVKKPIIIVKQTENKKPFSECTTESKDILIVNPAEFRQKMSQLQKRRNDCCKLAQEAFRKKSYSVASYYSHIASLYKERIIEMNKKSISLKLFDDKRTEVSTKLDLHFLFIPEALQVLDMFLDHHISDINRKNLNSLDLFLITGRGLRNRLKKSKLKPAIKKRLDQRGLGYSEQNPGMLRVTIRKNDCLSDQI